VTVSGNRLARPAWYRGWGLDVDDRAVPTRLILFHSDTPQADTHRQVVATAPFTEDIEEQTRWIDSVIDHTGTAAQLTSQLSMKVQGSRLRYAAE
jgi:hypothetical protein